MALRPVYSTMLMNETISGGDKVLTAPDNAVIVIREIIANELTGTANSQMYWYAPNAGRVWIWYRQSSDVVGNFQWQGRAVLSPGNSTRFHVAVGTWTFWISGYELPTP